MTTRFRAFYSTPLGVRFVDEDADDIDAEMAVARSREVFGLVHLDRVQQIGSVPEGAGDEAADERREEPLPGPGSDLGPCVVPTGEHDEHMRDVDAVSGAVARGGRVEDELVLFLGRPDEVKLHRLTDHCALVRGHVRCLVLKPPLEVSGLAGVLANLEEVDEQVRGDGVHSHHHHGKTGRQTSR